MEQQTNLEKEKEKEKEKKILKEEEKIVETRVGFS
jgi:hypothetical protein